MKYIDKYWNLKVGMDRNGIKHTFDTHECCICGRNTNFLDLISNVYLCSEECEDKYYATLNNLPV